MMDEDHRLAVRAAIADIDEMIRMTSIWDKKNGKLAVIMNMMQNKLRRVRDAVASANNSNIPPPTDMRK